MQAAASQLATNVRPVSTAAVTAPVPISFQPQRCADAEACAGATAWMCNWLGTANPAAAACSKAPAAGRLKPCVQSSLTAHMHDMHVAWLLHAMHTWPFGGVHVDVCVCIMHTLSKIL